MKYAIFESGGKQYKAVEGEFVEIDRLADESGSKLKLDKVLLFVDGDKINVGTPLVEETTILATVVEHFKGPKLIVFKYRPKKRIRVKTGHRQTYTRLLIEQVGDSKSEKAPAAEKPAKVVKTTKTVAATVVKTEQKPAAKKTTKTDKKPVVKKTASKTEKKPAPKKTTKAEAKPVAKKTTAKTEKKPAAKKPAAKKE